MPNNSALLTNDRPLTAAHVGQIANADALTAFFAELGYDVTRSLKLDHAALGLDSVDLRQQIRSIRRIGEDPVDGTLVLYLLEARSVTVSLVQAIARRFRERTEDALLVLTKDFETLDFVLLERELAARGGLGSGYRQVIRPRTLLVQRRNPGPVALRVLKRFTVTEEDGAFQWDKLRSAYTLAEWSEPHFNNRALFSDYYLLERLTDAKLTPAWEEDVRPIGREVLRHLSRARPAFSGQPEQVVRQQLYEPLFQSLGFAFQAHQPGGSDLGEPDYKLFAPGERGRPLALAMTTVWNRNLDDADPQRDRETPDEIPGARVVNVLAQAEAPWVILTNGKLWRLYSATAGNKATNYYEIDLEEAAAAAADQITALKYWWLFFRRQAFDGFLDQLLQQSADYAKGLGERLKERTFSTIFPYFAAGFVEGPKKLDFSEKSNFSTPDPTQKLDFSEKSNFSAPDLELVFSATLTFLYRLMFLLYAESLSLLPVSEERGYGPHSLRRLKLEIAEAAGAVEDEAPQRLQTRYDAASAVLYQHVQRLFEAVDKGDAALNLPMYNGGLFSNATPEGRFLAEHAIPDRFLAQGLDRLCRDVDDKTQALAMIDYKSLGVRQLGSIYEGLLEFKLRRAAEPLAVVKEKGKEVYLPARELGSRRAVATLPAGAVYLENDKRERKATGSYYTPDYIVKYIVEHTVGPVLERKFDALAPRLHAAQRQYRQRRAVAEVKQEDPEKFWNNREMQRLADDCLDVRVLDPAMGSGHFLVEAVDFVSNRLIQFLNAWSDNPVWALLAQTRQEILLDMERQAVSIDPERLTRVALLKRTVLKRCIYGVDLNAMAVELAKVSLWLDAFTLGAPLSFLDHHLKHGNSLIGARITEVQAALAPQEGETYSLLAGNQWAGIMLATDLMRQVSYQSDNTVGQLRASRAAFDSALDHLAPYKRILDVYTSRWFGNSPSKAGFDPVREFLRRPDVEAWLRDPARARFPAKDYMNAQAVAETALRAAREKRFFHWELEFPEVFFAPSAPGGQDVQLRADGGFDAVVGNPPWISLGGMTDDSRKYYRDAYESPQGKYDIFVVFVERGMRLGRQFGMIIPNRFLRSNYGESLRYVILKEPSHWEIIEFASNDLFGDATTYPCIMLSRPSDDPHKNVRLAKVGSNLPALSDLVDVVFSSVTPNDFHDGKLGSRAIEVASERVISSQRLAELVVQIGQGIYTGAKEVFTTESPDLFEPDVIRKVIDGADLKRYDLPTSSTYVIYPYRVDHGQLRLLNLEEYPKAYQHLKQHLSLLMNRRFWGETIESAGKQFYEIWNPSPFMFAQKIIYAEIASQPTFTIDLTGDVAVLKTCYCMVFKKGQPYSLLYLLALLNSNLLFHWLRQRSPTMRGGRHYRFLTQYVEDLPIRAINFITNSDRRAQLATKGRALYQRCLAEGHACVLEFVAHHLALDESDVVHDLLAFLAGQMIELNMQKQAETKRFLGWLEQRIKILPKNGETDLDSLPGKTILQGYLGDYQKGERETP
ncbi:MAG TPA: Eco57I restriction-modification methylase domain-containing protein, partial [Anaerolineae bacterium]|nr:Eco57I restriction-modification methylase domain-containing protein [Anaerolineae bacterium]